MVPITTSAGAVAWFKSSYSGGNTTECVEVAHLTRVLAVRDSKAVEGPRLAFSTGAWADFVGALRASRLV
ncbi:DUF397 domain-containing protein [Streptomyces sp. NBC_00838]|uniref:DUF397 domain-containing protein n=1 Tax=Streptomyces sp. NBC_00838 TaxID=2903680 RepID=UPI0038686DA8|nr:DUF397 domain-containing protein [Streptomyces sp. NBC_00838]